MRSRRLQARGSERIGNQRQGDVIRVWHEPWFARQFSEVNFAASRPRTLDAGNHVHSLVEQKFRSEIVAEDGIQNSAQHEIKLALTQHSTQGHGVGLTDLKSDLRILSGESRDDGGD